MIETFLLGAGASKEADIPTSREMVQAIAARFEASRDAVSLDERVRRRAKYDPSPAERDTDLLYFVIGGLQLHTATSRRNPLTEGVDVERLFSAVQMLAERRTLEIAPFVATWHPHLDQFDVHRPAPWFFDGLLIDSIAPALAGELRRSRPLPSPTPHPGIRRALDTLTGKAVDTGFVVEDPAGILTQAVLDLIVERLEHPRGVRSDPMGSADGEAPPLPAQVLDDRFARFVDERFALPPDGTVFGEVAKRMIAALVELVWIEDAARIRYLAPLVSYAAGRNAVIATLNYDNAVELQARAAGVPCSTGIASWSKGRRVAWPDGAVRLLKLHGSIDWKLEREHYPLPQYRVSQAEPDSLRAEGFEPAIIFGQRNKLTHEGPFLDLLRAFSDVLERTDRLTAIGYSFRDDHINTEITRWLQGGAGRTLRIVDPYFATSEAEYASLLRRIAEEEPGRVQVFAEGAGSAVAKLCAA